MKLTRKLAISGIKAQKTRSVLTAAAIFFTTVLITVISFGCRAILQEQKSNAAEMYGEQFGTIAAPTRQQKEDLKLHARFYNLGTKTYAANVILKGYDVNAYAMDATMQMLSHFRPESGTYPEKENEILAQREFFKAQGYENPGVGDAVTLTIRINGAGEQLQKEFVISGFLSSSKSNDLAKQYSVYVSLPFLDAYLKDEEARAASLGFQVSNETNLNAEELKKDILQMTAALGIKEKQVSINTPYLMLAFDPGMEILLPALCILLTILIVSSLVIYNIFHVAIIQRIREYGRLKALGADRRQLRQILLTEALALSAVSIPSGILSGVLILKAAFYALSQKNSSVFSLPLAVFVVFFTLLSVLLSIRKPMKTAAKISPVEAIRYEDKKSGRRRKAKNRITVFSLTMSNLALHKKRTLTTIFTMGLSCVLFVVIANVAGNMDADRQARENLEYGRFRIEIDGALNDQTYPEHNLYEIQKTKILGSDFIRRVRSIPGVTDIRTRKIAEAYITNPNTGKSAYDAIAIVNEEEFNWLKKNAERGVVDYDNTAAQNGVLYMWDHFLDEEYRIGDTFQCEILDGDRRVPFQGPILGSCGHSNDAVYTMTEATFQSLGIQEDMTSIVFIDCEKDAEASVKAALTDLEASMEHLSLTCYDDTLALIDLQIRFTKNACYTFLIILAAIGFMNMANTMITNIVTRKREFGILQALGMSNRQFNCMLQLEGLLFTAGTLFISLLPGNLLGYAAFCFCKKEGFIGLFSYRLPVFELLCFTFAIIGLQAALAFLLSRNVKKEALVDRIRYHE